MTYGLEPDRGGGGAFQQERRGLQRVRGALEPVRSAFASPPRPETLLRAGAIGALLAGIAVAGAHALLGVDPELAARLLPPCPFHAASGLPCPGCGMTRALAALASFELREALVLHPLAPAVPALAGALAVRPRLLEAVPQRLARLGLAALLAFWAARLLA